MYAIRSYYDFERRQANDKPLDLAPYAAALAPFKGGRFLEQSKFLRKALTYQNVRAIAEIVITSYSIHYTKLYDRDQ